MSRDSHPFFDSFFRNPDPHDVAPDDYRWEWRPISQNPFVERKPNESREQDTHTKDLDGPVVKNEAPKWVYLFYDLAWTATFASLTQNGRFNAPWAMYTIHFYTNDWFHFLSNLAQLVIFGTLAATTHGYNIANYIVHSPGSEILESPPRQMSKITDPKIYNDEVVAATSLEVIVISITISRIVLFIQYVRVIIYAYTVAPKDHRALWKLAIVPISIFVSISLFGAAWGISTSASGRVPYGAKLKFVFWGASLIVEVFAHIVREQIDWRQPLERNPPQSVSVSCPPVEDYLLAKDARTSKATRSSEGTQLYPGTPDMETPGALEDKSPVPGPANHLPVLLSAKGSVGGAGKNRLPISYTNTTLAERLEGVTTIILGEGINGIAGALWAVISAPGNKGSAISNAISAAIAVCFITYFYFEGPRSRRGPNGLRQMIWLLLHLPFLLGIILLLLGMKDQFLLTSFLSTVVTSLGFPQLIAQEGIDLTSPSSGTNEVLTQYLIKRGVMWSEEWGNLTSKLGPIVGGIKNQTQNFEIIAWHRRLSLTICLKTFKTFMGEAREISEDIQSKIDFYYANRSNPVFDQRIADRRGPTNTMEYYKILTSLVEANVTGARYIIGLAGGVLICLSLLSITHSKPRDRFQWGVILSRFTMGWCLLLLLLLNLGRDQTLWIYPEQKKHQAGVFQWITVFDASRYWALPTIALAHLIELGIETASYIKINATSSLPIYNA